MPHTKIILYFLLLLLTKQSIAVTTKLDSAYIEHFATNYLTEKFPSTDSERVRISVSHLDPRIVIKPCKIPLKANIPEKSIARNLNIKISCDESTPWKIYLSAKVEITKAILVALNTISKGDTLNESNVALTYIAINKIRGNKLEDMSVVSGAKAKKRIAKGRAISKSNICLICKGDMVTIIVSSESFNIKTQGLALSSGNINEQIKVRNTRSNKVITPRVKNANQVIIHI
jgi:flagella basal body P-ring formation protein FlgA